MSAPPAAANLQMPGYARSRARPRPSVSPIAYWTFIALFLYSLLNLGGIYTQIFGSLSVGPIVLPVNPIFFLICMVPIMVLTPPRRVGRAFVVSWIFWLTYTVGGFLGPYQLTDMSLYTVGQVVIKIWITIIGVPWLAMRVIDRERLPQLVRIASAMIAFGALVSILQAFYPRLIAAAMWSEGRGAGLWINPNSCGAICGMGVFLNLAYPFRWKITNYAFRTILVLGVLFTLSRGSILGFVLASIIYGLATKRVMAVVKSVIAVLAVSLIGVIALQFLDTSLSPNFERRVRLVESFLQGDVSSEQQSSRMVIWYKALEAVSEDWLLGRGHGAMNAVVDMADGLGPHNYYLYVWGNSGFAGLLALLFFLLALLRSASKCGEMHTRAALFAITALLAILMVFSHALLQHQFLAAIFSLMVLIGHYGRPQRRPMGPPRTMTMQPLPAMPR